jgi:antitoxin HicB
MSTRSYIVVFQPQPEGGYTVTVPALPGCITEGDAFESAREMARDAIKAYCESLVADGAPPACPTGGAERRRHPRA